MSRNTNPIADLEIEQRIERAEAALTALLAQGSPVCVSWSAGKDSSAVLNLVLGAAAKYKAAGGVVPPIVVTHADTMVENPEMTLYARNEMVQVCAYAKRHGLDVTIEVATPNLTAQWSVRVIGGRALPPFPGTNRDCTLDWKIQPMKRLRKSVLKHLAKRAGSSSQTEPVVLLGTRYDESDERARNMHERGESDIQIRRGVDENGKESHLFLSPIAWWSTDDVWMYLGLARAGAVEAYSDFEETIRVYADAMGQSCVIVAEDMSKALKANKACGARHGCSLCTVASVDQSMENMLAHDERYNYMRGLNELRNFLMATRWDMARRSWLGRTINEGYVRIAPDAYSPGMMEELLRYSLTIDVREQEAAYGLGIRPRFQLVTVEQLFAIDAMWSLQAFHKPFHALKIWDEIQKGARFDVPKLAAFPRQPEFPVRHLWVGRDWEDGQEMRYTGLNSAIHEMTSVDGGACMGTKELADGRTVMDVNTAPMMEIDIEAAYFLLDDIDRLLERHDSPRAHPTEAYHYYMQLGMLSIKSGLQGEVDGILRRSAYKVREGIDGNVSWKTLWDKAVTPTEAGLAAKGTQKRARGADGSLSVAHLDLLPQGVPEQIALPEQPSLFERFAA
jgi:DNA sulfur modification protein DndC